MIKYSRILFIYSFTSFLFVILFGSMNAPLKKAFYGSAIWNNIALFHNHFDQLCWLGAAAIGSILYFMSDKYNGSIKIVGVFSYLYIFASFVFSSAFIARSLGIYLHKEFLEKTVFTIMVSSSGLAYVLIIIFGIYILKSFFRNVVLTKHTI